ESSTSGRLPRVLAARPAGSGEGADGRAHAPAADPTRPARGSRREGVDRRTKITPSNSSPRVAGANEPASCTATAPTARNRRGARNHGSTAEPAASLRSSRNTSGPTSASSLSTVPAGAGPATLAPTPPNSGSYAV